MAITYLKHSIHGTKVATMNAEVEYDLRNGWEEYDPHAVEEVVEDVLVDEPVVDNALAPKSRRKAV